MHAAKGTGPHRPGDVRERRQTQRSGLKGEAVEGEVAEEPAEAMRAWVILRLWRDMPPPHLRTPRTASHAAARITGTTPYTLR